MWQLWRTPAEDVAVPRTVNGGYAELRQAERYRDSLTPGSAEWEGAAALVARARRMVDAAIQGTH